MSHVCPTCGRRRNGRRETESERSADSVQRVVRRLKDGDDMLKDPLEQEGKEIGITLNAAGEGILLQLGEEPTCHKCELHQIRVTLTRGEAVALQHKLTRLIACLPEPPSDQAQRGRDAAHE